MPPSRFQNLNPVEQDLYKRFRDAYEAYDACAWETERLAADARRARDAGGGEDLTAREAAQAEADKRLNAALANVKVLVEEASKSLAGAQAFGGDVIGPDGLANTIQRLIERDVLEEGGDAYRNILKTALLNAFLSREKEARASIYKKRVRGGFRGSAESIIQEERKKNESWREDMFAKYAAGLSPQDTDLVRFAFRLRMARHGQEVST